MQAELTATVYLGPMQWGVTSPQLFRAGDGNLYVVKLFGNKIGPKALANEALAMVLGSKIDLCFPPSGIVWLDSKLLQQNKRLRKTAVHLGPHFACRYLSRSTYVNRFELNRAANRKELAGVMLFDHMLHNIDRTHNRKNLLIRMENGQHRIYAIDHSHLFRRGRWTINSLMDLEDDLTVNTRRTYGLLLKHYLYPQDFADYAAAIKALGDEELEQAVNTIPEEWLPDADERRALAHHLAVRRNRIDAIVERLVSLIPTERKVKASVNVHAETETGQVAEGVLESIAEQEVLPESTMLGEASILQAATQRKEKQSGKDRRVYRCHPYRAYHGPKPNKRIAVKESQLRARYGDVYGSLWFI